MNQCGKSADEIDADLQLSSADDSLELDRAAGYLRNVEVGTIQFGGTNITMFAGFSPGDFDDDPATTGIDPGVDGILQENELGDSVGFPRSDDRVQEERTRTAAIRICGIDDHGLAAP